MALKFCLLLLHYFYFVKPFYFFFSILNEIIKTPSMSSLMSIVFTLPSFLLSIVTWPMSFASFLTPIVVKSLFLILFCNLLKKIETFAMNFLMDVTCLKHLETFTLEITLLLHCCLLIFGEKSASNYGGKCKQ